MKILHLINGLQLGGTEQMLVRLASEQKKSGHEPAVISISDGGTMYAALESIGVKYYVAKSRNLWHLIIHLMTVIRLIRKFRPDVTQSWMYHADLFGGLLLAVGIVQRPLVWNIRQSDLSATHTKRSTRLVARLCAGVSSFVPNRIVSNSAKALATHSDYGYDMSRSIRIPNGFDTKFYRPRPDMEDKVREELKLLPDEQLVGLFARYDPQKDHDNFIESCFRVMERKNSVTFVLCGKNVDESNAYLYGKIRERSCEEKFRLLGERHDIPELMSAMDVVVSASYGEGFPNVVGEAMSCGTPCVVTNAGDSAVLVEDTGKIVPCRNPGALADGVLSLLNLDSRARRRLGEKARRRIIGNFSIEAIARQYETLYVEESRRVGLRQ